jgi:RNA polymerase-binding transcription factor DksA
VTAKKKTVVKKSSAKPAGKPAAAGKAAAAHKPAAAKAAVAAKPAAPVKTAAPVKATALDKAGHGAKSAKPRAAATATSILGRPLTRAMDYKPAKVKPEWQKYYQILIELRERLVQQMSGLAKDSAEELPGYSLHMADSGTDNFDRDFALSLLSSDQDAVYEIEEALKRIERGSYGVCELTGKAIPKARLEAIPWTRFTVEAQMQLERDGHLRQRRLGALGTVDNLTSVEAEDGEAEEEERPAKERE